MIKWNALSERIARTKIRTKLFLLILITGALCLTLFRFLWHRKWSVYYFLAENLPSETLLLPMPDGDFFGKLRKEALKYDIPDSEDDKEAVEAIQPLFSLADEYNSNAI